MFSKTSSPGGEWSAERAYFLLGTTRCAGLEYPQASGCWYHWHCPHGWVPSQRIFLRRHSTQALLVDMRRAPAARVGLLEVLSPSEPGDRSPTEDWKVWNMLTCHASPAILWWQGPRGEIDGSTAHAVDASAGMNAERNQSG